jgi:glycosyltransferase involved in cell wall biosynthesis
MDPDYKALSIMFDGLGHRTYGNLMREYFHQMTPDGVDFYWFTEERELLTRILLKPLFFSVPNEWVREQNLDFRRFRGETALACVARHLLTRKLKQKDYSVLHLHTQAMACLSVDVMKKIPTVVGIDFTAVLASQECTDPEFRWTYYPNTRLDQRVFEAAACIVAWSERARKSVIEDYQIDDRKVKTIPPGVNLDLLKFSDSARNTCHRPCRILFVGADFQRKGGNDLLEVFLENFSDSAELHLVTSASVFCSHPHVHIHRNVKAYSPEWLNLYAEADVFVMPTYAEALGLVFMEAMAAGLPVIATQLPQISEVVLDGETGFLIQPGDRSSLTQNIQSLIENPTLRFDMGAKGRKIVEQKFNAYANFQVLETIFRELSVSKSVTLQGGKSGN